MKKKVLLLALIALVGNVNAQQDSATGILLQSVTISGIRAGKNTPITQYNLTSKQIKNLYYGADLPSVLQQAPSINSYSDNGTGIGYSYFNMRGIDQSRINVTVNGVPVNDPQNQGTFFNNFADLASSAHSIQIQRGVGSSTNGAAAFGGSVNIFTQPISNNASAEINAGFGSFNSRRLTAEIQTGKLSEHWGMYMRLSNLSTNGFRNNSASQITSYFFSAGRQTEKSLLKINVWGGDAQSQLSYLGASKTDLNNSRKYNPLTLNESDRFKQNFFQVQYNYRLGKKQSISSAAYFVRGVAPYFNYYFPDYFAMPYAYFNMPEPIIGKDTIKVAETMTSYKLNQFFYGAFANYQLKHNGLNINAGFHLNRFISEHSLETEWMRYLPAGINNTHQAYFNTGYKQEASVYVKAEYFLKEKLILFTDLQLRNAMFSYKPQQMTIAQNAFIVEDMKWIFFNPKIGLSSNINKNTNLYVMAGITGREPTRMDYFRDDFATRNIAQNEIKPEYVTDIESGVRINNSNLQLNINAYYMLFKNAIINTGELNNFGAAITTNVAQVLRSGIETDINWLLTNKITLIHASAFSYNNISSITQYYTDTATFTNVGIAFNNTRPALSPNIIINQGVKYMPVQNFYILLNTRYVSKQYTDNSSLNLAAINAYTIADATMGLNLNQWLKQQVMITFKINNLLNNTYNTWGNTAAFSNIATGNGNGQFTPSVTPLFFAAPPRNFFITLTVKF